MRVLIIARNRTVAVENGGIIQPEGRFDRILEFPDGDLRPGLINGHDHLHRNHYGRLGGRRYRNAYQWAADIQKRFARRIAEGRSKPRREALLAGAWKNLFSGVTTVVHHDAWEADFDADFPLHVHRVRNADSLGMTPSLKGAASGEPFSLHLAEGIDAVAASEVGLLAARGLLTLNLVAAHGVGMDDDGIAQFRNSGAALVWCPSSNVFLFGRTAPDALLRDGVDVLVGSDSLLTGAGDLLDELRFARAYGSLSEQRLTDAVGAVAARRIGAAPPSLEPGAGADLVILAKPLFEATADDVLLVMVGGVPRVARPDHASRVETVAPGGEAMKVGSVMRWANGRTFRECQGSLH
ncbi:MAG: amidohydrolase family protein [Sphingomonadales bacterium]